MKNINKNKCHSKLDLESHRFLKQQQGEILNQVQDDVFFYNNGFTLIELLVVVLIIGILAAVALPQYQKAVDKSRYVQAMTLVEKIKQSNERYRLANGSYTYSFDELDLDMPAPTSINSDGNNTYYYPWGRCWLQSGNYTACEIFLGSSDDSVAAYVDFYLGGRTLKQCWTRPATNQRGNKLCQFITKKQTGDLSGYWKQYFF